MISPSMFLSMERGDTRYGTDSPGTQPNVLGHTKAFEGFPVEKLEASGQPTTGVPIVCTLVKNASGIALKPGRIVTWKNDADNPFMTAVGGYAYAATDWVAGVVDEFLPAAGVQANDIFWLVRYGFTKVRSAGSGSYTIDIGDKLGPGTGTSATNDDAGRAFEIVPTTVALLESMFGRAQEACTTNNALFRAWINTIGRTF